MQRAPHDLAGRRVLITGGSGGIGAATAVALRAAGATVALTGRSGTSLASAAARSEAVFMAADLREPDAAGCVVNWAARTLGGLDTLVCAAGSGWLGPFGEMTSADITTLVDLNLRVPMETVRAALKPLSESACGGIVLVGSIVGLVGVQDEAAYSATKGGIAVFADALRLELGDKLTVSLVSPATVDTQFFARRNRPYERRWPRPMPVDRVARAIVHAVATGRPSTVVPPWMGVAIRLHGAAPAFYRALARRFG